MKKIFLLIIGIISIIVSIAQPCQLQGKIVDTNNVPLNGATIYINELNKGTSSNNNGDFIISRLGKGVYNIQFSYIGYHTKIIKVNLIEKDTTTLLIELQKSTININEVVISSAFTNAQDENTQIVDVIKKNDMQKYGAFTVMDIINKIPGVDAVTTGPLVTRPIIRGLSSNRILTIIDGVRFETQQWDDEHGIGVNELGVDRIEIIKGPSSLIYGPEAMGGIVHFIDEHAANIGKTEGDLKTTFFSNNFGGVTNFNIKGAKEKYNWGINVLGKVFSDYFYNGYDFRVPNTRLTEYGGKGYIGINRKWGATKLSYLFNTAYYGILDGKDIVKKPDGSIVNTDSLEKEKFPVETEAPFHFVMDNRINSNTTILVGKSKLQLILGYQNNHRSEHEELSGKKKGYNYVDITLQSSTYNLKWYLPTFKNFSTIIGSQGMYKNNSNSSAASTQLIPDATIADVGFFVLTKYQFKNFSFNVGGRYDARSLNTVTRIDSIVNMPGISRSYDNISGSFSVAYKLKKHLILRASYSSGYRSPNLNELMANGVKLESLTYEKGNPNFKKEFNTEVDINLTFKSKHFSLTAAAYQNNINNFIYLAPTDIYVASGITRAPFVPVYQFLQDNAVIKGGEATLNIHPNAKWFDYEVRTSTLTAIRTNDNSYLPMMPTNKIYNTLTFSFDQLKKFEKVYFRIGTMTALKQFKVADTEQKTPSYTLLNAGLGAVLNDFEFSLAANNILDKIYLDNMSRFRSYEIYGPGLSISISVKKYFNFNKSK